MTRQTSAPIRSMTGYALARKQTGAGELSVSLRAVNHRGLDIHFHAGSDFAPLENTLRAVVKQNVARGHVELRLSLAREASGGAGAYNRDLLARYLAAFHAAREEFGLDSQPDLNTVFTFPGVLDAPSGAQTLDGDFAAQVAEALGECVLELNAFREREGAQLAKEIEAEVASVEQATIQIAGIRAQILGALQQRLRERLTDLLANSTLTEARLAEEAALLADRSDIAEELTRLEVHTGEVRRILAGGGEVGKRLDFLLQEMNRETNTILSKTSGTGDLGLTLTSLGLGIKANIERIREQALNLE